MTNGNEKPGIRIRIGEPTYNASTSDDTTRGGAEEPTWSSVDRSPACCLARQ